MLDIKAARGIARFGLMANEAWHQDPRRTLFHLSRYKFVAKMLERQAAGTRNWLRRCLWDALVQQEVGHLTAVDFDPIFVADVKERIDSHRLMECFVRDIIKEPVPGIFGAAYCLDVIEHIAPDNEDRFLSNILQSLPPDGVLIVGAPSLESQVHASPQSKAGHVNCKTGTALKELLRKYLANVFVFSMNDEVVHTGFYPMAHYLLALCCGRLKA